MAFDHAKISGPKQRAKVLLRTRNLKMARDAHAYVRGSTVKFYEGWKTGAGSCPRGRRYGSAAIAISEIWDLSLTLTATSTFKFAISIRPSSEIPSTTSCGWRCRWRRRPEDPICLA
jgi:hypothetical protein